jgi:hypothetical protein
MGLMTACLFHPRRGNLTGGVNKIGRPHLRPNTSPMFYRLNNPDLNVFDEEQLFKHALHHGRSEGRLMSPASDERAFR